MFKNFQQLARKNHASGHHWFEPSSFNFFNTEIESSLLARNGRQYFVTSDRAELKDDKRYTLRLVNADGTIETHGNLRDYRTINDAIRAARKVF